MIHHSPEYFADLRRKANANLATPAKERRARLERERAAARAAARAADQAHRATQRAHVAYLRDERTRLRAELTDLDATEADIRADSFYNRDPATLQGALEELDSMRNTLSARIARLDSDLRRS